VLRPDGPLARPGDEPRAVPGLGAEPVLQTGQHGVLPDRRSASRSERPPRSESARGDRRDSAPGPRRARTVLRVGGRAAGFFEADRLQTGAARGTFQRPEPDEPASASGARAAELG